MVFSEDSPNTVPLHTLGKEWFYVFEADGLVCVQPVRRSQHGGYDRREGNPMTPAKAEELIKALKRVIKDAKKNGSA